MALLPLAGWAADFATATVSINDVPYGRDVAISDITLKINGNDVTGIQWDGKYYKAYDATTRTFSQLVELEEGEFPTYGTYYIKITPTNTGENNGFAMGQVLIRKRVLTIDFVAVSKDFQYEKNRAASEKDASYIKYTIKDVDASTQQTPVTYEPFATAAAGADDEAVAAAAAKAAAGQAFVEEIGLKVGRVGADTQFDAKSYDFTFEISKDAPYTMSIATTDQDKFKITPKSILSITDPDATHKAFTMTAAASYTYTGKDQKPTFTVIDGLGNEITNSIDVYWVTTAPTGNLSAEQLAAAVTPNGAGTYYAVLVGRDKTNYTGQKYDATNWKFTIKKAQVELSILPMSSEYDGQPISLANAKIDYRGIVNADARGIIDNFGNKLSVVFSESSLNTTAPKDVLWTTDATPVVDPNGYKLSIKLVNGIEETSLFKNYQIMFKGEQDETATLHDIDNTSIASVTGYYKITQRSITIKPKTIEMEYGASKPTVPTEAKLDAYNAQGVQTTVGTVDITSDKKMVEGENFLPAITFAVTDKAQNGGPGATAINWNAAPAGSTWTGKVTMGWSTSNETNISTALNYKKNYNVSLTPGDVTVVGKGLTVYVNTNVVEYGDDLTNFDFGYNAGGQRLAGTPQYKVYNVDTEEEITDLTNLPINTYLVKMVEDQKLSPKNYKINGFRNGYLFVEPKEITVTINPLTLNPGTTVETLNDYAGVDESYKENLVGDDKETGLTFKFAFNGDAEKTVTSGTAPKLSDVLATDQTTHAVTGLSDGDIEGDYAKGIIATVIAKDANDEDNGWIAANNNYKVTFVPGALKIVKGGVLYLTQTDKYLDDKVKAAAEACAAAPAQGYPATTYTVTFGERWLKANTWYTMVLPFDVKTTELVAGLKGVNKITNAQTGAVTITDNDQPVYAIVNRLAKSTATNVNFKLEMKSIPANEPFLIKVAEDVKLSNVHISFTGKTIKYKATPKAEAEGVDYGGNEFIGTYTDIDDLPAKFNLTTQYFAFMGNADMIGSRGQALDNDWYKATLSGLVIRPTEAYLHYAERTADAGAPVITIEDVDFSTGATSIKTLNAENMKAYAVDGWYTLNGIKLQSMPTEKGVYINNGKKVVIK